MGRIATTIPDHFHVGVQYVHANDRRSSTAAASSYIRRGRESDVRDRGAIVDAASYIRRQHQLEAAQRDEVVGHRFFCRGDWSAADVWSHVDRAALTKAGQYHRRAGGTPRLGILGEFSYPWDVSESTKIRLSHQLAQAIVDEYGAAVEVISHRKPDALERGADHCHLLISMREVDAHGVGK